MGHKTLLPVDVVLKTLNFSLSVAEQNSGKNVQPQREMLPYRRGEE
jgi:hypothetical protein